MKGKQEATGFGKKRAASTRNRLKDQVGRATQKRRRTEAAARWGSRLRESLFYF